MTISRWLAGCGVAMAVALAAAMPIAPVVAADEPAANEPATIERLPDDTVIATVGDKPVTAADLRIAFQLLPQQYYFLPADFLLETVLQQMIDVRLMADAAVRAGVDAAQIDRQTQFYRDRLLRQEYLKKRADSEITPALVKERYDAMVKEHKAEEEVHAHHILVKTEDEVKAIVAELGKGGNFEEIARAKTIDESSKASGGDLGFFTKGRMVPEFEAAAFATEVGKVSAPVQTQYGWHLIKVDEKRMSAPPTFESVVPQLRDELMAQLVENAGKDLRQGIKIETGKFDAYAVLGLPKPPPSAEDSAPAGGAEGEAAPAPAESKPADGKPAEGAPSE